MESITDWAFSWPISVRLGVSRELGGARLEGDGGRAYVGSSRRRCGGGCGLCYGLCARSWSRA